MNAFLQALNSFFIVMGVVSSILLIIGFVLKAKGVSFVEFFPKRQEGVTPTSNVYYNTYNTTQVSSNIDSRKVAAIMAAIKYHNSIKG